VLRELATTGSSDWLQATGSAIAALESAGDR
jgi:hypothetical protein